MIKTFQVVSLTLKLLPLALFSLLSSCGGGGEADSGSIPPGVVTPAPVPPGLVVPIAPGKLLPVEATTIETKNGLMTMAVNPHNNDVYVTTFHGNSASDLYSTLSVMRPDNVTGLLTQVWIVYKVQGLTWVTQIQVDPTGKYLYFYGRTNTGGGAAISVYNINSDGLPFYINTTPVDAGNIFTCCLNTLTGITLSPDGRYIYGYYPVSTSDGISESITVYGVDQNATITSLGSAALPYIFQQNGSSPSVLHSLVASNQYVYVRHMDGSGISTYSNNNGQLTLVSDGRNVNTTNRAMAMAIDPNGQFLYSAALVDNQIKIYIHSIAMNGSLEIVNIVDGISGAGIPFDMAIDSSNRTLYLFQSNGIGMYRINIPGEVLVPLGMQSTYINRNTGVESPGFFAMNTSGKYLYTLGLADKPTLSTFLVAQPVAN